MNRVPDVEKIAVLRANSLGDFIFTLPALTALRWAYPESEIVLLGAPWHAEFWDRRPGPVDRVLVIPALPGLRRPVDNDPGPTREEFFERARAERFDLAIQLHGGGANANPFVRALGARLTAGLRAEDAPPLDRWVRYLHYQPEVFRYLEVVSLVGAEAVDWRPFLIPTRRDVAEALSMAGVAEKRVALHPGATDPRRRWPVERFAAVGDALAEAGAEVVVTGSAEEKELTQSVVRHMKADAMDLAGRLSLGGLAGLYAGCGVVVSNDTGPLHLAVAVGTATVGIFWVGNLINGAPMERTRHRPLPSWTVTCPECGQDATRTPRCPHDPPFVTDVPAAEAIQASLELLNTSTASKHSIGRSGTVVGVSKWNAPLGTMPAAP
jgi:ADP-heptose:LPS heptosyltransferase